jgi:hypothetical protein
MSIRACVRHLEQGDWEQAHAIAQAEKSQLGAWAHAIVHLQEGDIDNARYWFGQARRQFSQDVTAELRALALALGVAEPQKQRIAALRRRLER